MKKIYTFIFVCLLIRGTTHAQTWTAVNSGLGALTTKGITVSNDTLFTAVLGQGVYYSTDFGSSWQSWWGNSQVSNNNFNTFYGANVGGLLQAGFFFGLGQGLMFYFESGNGLFNIPIGSLPNQNLRSYIKVQIPENSFYGTDQGIFYSNNLTSFTASTGFSGNSLVINSIFENADTIFAGTNEGLYVSFDNGQSFSLSNIGTAPNDRINQVGFYTLTSNGVYLMPSNTSAFPVVSSGDYRTSYLDYSTFDSYLFGDNVGKLINLQNPFAATDIPLDGITGGVIIGTTLKGNYLFVCTENGGVFRTLLSTLTTAKTKESNPTISIQPNPNNGLFSILNSTIENSSIQIFDVTGREINTIKTSTNSLYTRLDLSNESNGIYFVKIISKSGSVKTEKIIIEK